MQTYLYSLLNSPSLWSASAASSASPSCSQTPPPRVRRRNPNPSRHLRRRYGEQQRLHRLHLRHRWCHLQGQGGFHHLRSRRRRPQRAPGCKYRWFLDPPALTSSNLCLIWWLRFGSGPETLALGDEDAALRRNLGEHRPHQGVRRVCRRHHRNNTARAWPQRALRGYIRGVRHPDSRHAVPTSEAESLDCPLNIAWSMQLGIWDARFWRGWLWLFADATADPDPNSSSRDRRRNV